MSCNLDSFRERFPEVGNRNVINLTNSPKLSEIVSWVNMANTQAEEQGFNLPLYEIKYETIDKILSRKANHRNETYQRKILTVNTQNLDLYQEFIRQEIMSDIEFARDFNEETLSAFDLDSNESNELLNAQENRVDYNYEGELFSSIPYDAEDLSNLSEDPVNFKEWVEQREYLLDNLKTTRQKLLAQKANKNQLTQINTSIYNLEKELSEIDKDDIHNIHGSIFKEFENLQKLIEVASDRNSDPLISSTLIDNNFVRQRIENLKYSLNDKVMSDTLVNFHRGLTEEEVEILRGKLGNLEDTYEKAIPIILENIIMNNDYMYQLKSFSKQNNDKESQEQLERLEKRVQAILDPENLKQTAEGDSLFGKGFLGAKSYDSILTEIMAITRDMNQVKEAGINNLHKKALQTSYEKLSAITHKNGGKTDYYIDSLWSKDEFGQLTNRLISPFTPQYYSKIKFINNARKEFYKTAKYSIEQSEAYEQWAETLANNVDFIEPYRLAEVAEKYANVDEFREFFEGDKAYSKEEMESYKQELINKIGQTAYDIEVKKQMNSLDNYLADGFVTEKDKYHKNPMRFIENFYTDNYNKADATTGEFLLPNYTTFMPNMANDSFFNKEFNKVEKEGGEAFTQFYHAATSLLQYNHDAFASIGMDINPNDIINIQEKVGRAAMAELTSFQKVGTNMKAIWSSVWDSFYEGSHEADPSKRNDGIRSHYNNYGESEKRKIVKYYVNEQSFDQTLAKMNELGLQLPGRFQSLLNNTPQGKKLEQVKKYVQSQIAEAIGTKMVNKSSSLDILKRISYSNAIAESVVTRNSTLGVIGVIKDYAEKNKLTNTLSYVETWEANNIIQPGALTGSRLGRAEAVEWKFLNKRYTEIEKGLKEIYEKEIKNIEDKNYFDFKAVQNITDKDSLDTSKKGFIYTTEEDNPDGKYFKTSINEEGNIDENSEKEAIGFDEIADAYEKYLRNELEKLGTRTTGGKVINGLLWNMFKHYLYFNPISGFNNRQQGKMQNNQAAASGLHDFNADHLLNARWLLTGTGTKKLMDYAGLPKLIGLNNTKRVQQWNILMHLVENLQLLDSVVQDVSGGEGGQFNESGGLKEFMGDFAMNIPETHNQLELLVAIMQNPKYAIKDIDGNERLLFDPKSMTFPFDPKTMQLLPEYRTQENIEMWEKFSTTDSGNASQNVLIQKYKEVKNKLHGNYASNDKMALQSLMMGRGVTAFMKWAYENFNNQYGTKKVSLTKGEVDIKGRKIVLMERFPVMMTHMLITNVGLTGLVGGGVGLFSGAGVLGAVGAGALLSFPVIAGVSSLGMLTYQIVKNRQNIKMSWQDAGLSLNYANEIFLRSIKTITTSTLMNTGLSRALSMKEETIDKILGTTEEKWKNRSTSLKSRKMMSESAQEVADKITTYVQFGIAIQALKGMVYLLAMMNAGDDEDKLKEEYLAKLEKIEGNIKFLINTRDNLALEGEKWSSPGMLADTYDQLVFGTFLSKAHTTLTETQEKIDDGTVSEFDGNYKMMVAAGGLVGVPKKFMEMGYWGLSYDHKNPILEHDRIYKAKAKSPFDDWLLNGHKEGEARYEPQLQKARKKLRKDLQPVVVKQLRDAGIDDPNNDLIKKNIDKILKSNGALKSNKKGRKKTSQEMLENVDWEGILESTRDGENSLITE